VCIHWRRLTLILQRKPRFSRLICQLEWWGKFFGPCPVFGKHIYVLSNLLNPLINSSYYYIKMFSRERVQKSNWLAQFKVKTALSISAVSCNQTSALTRKSTLVKAAIECPQNSSVFPSQTRPDQEVKFNPKQGQSQHSNSFKLLSWNLQSTCNLVCG